VLVSEAFEFLQKSVNSYGAELYGDSVPEKTKGQPLIGGGFFELFCSLYIWRASPSPKISPKIYASSAKKKLRRQAR